MLFYAMAVSKQLMFIIALVRGVFDLQFDKRKRKKTIRNVYKEKLAYRIHSEFFLVFKFVISFDTSSSNFTVR